MLSEVFDAARLVKEQKNTGERWEEVGDDTALQY